MNHSRTLWTDLSAAALALLIGACASSGIHPDDASGSHPLWKIEGENNTVWLLGSVHMLPPNAFPLPSAFDQAFESTSVSVFEIDMSNIGMMEMMGLFSSMMLPPGQKLHDVLSPETMGLLEPRLGELTATFRDQMSGMSSDGDGAESLGALGGMLDASMMEDLILGMQPWFVGYIIQSSQASSSDLELGPGVDMHYTERSQEKEREILGLESMNDQLKLFKQMAGDDPDSYIQAMLEQQDTAAVGLGEIIEAWQAGDIEALDAIVNGALRSSHDMYQSFLVDRNENWIPHIERYARDDKDYFVVVGAAHLVGDDSVVSMLRKRGYRVVRQ